MVRPSTSRDHTTLLGGSKSGRPPTDYGRNSSGFGVKSNLPLFRSKAFSLSEALLAVLTAPESKNRVERGEVASRALPSSGVVSQCYHPGVRLYTRGDVAEFLWRS